MQNIEWKGESGGSSHAGLTDSASTSRYVLVVLQYTAKIHAGKLTRFIRSLDPSRKGGQYQLAPAKVRAIGVEGVGLCGDGDVL